jgi:hypothetical protein
MPKVKNISDGPRGAYNGRELVMAERGQTIEADDYAAEWFEEVGDAPKHLSQMNKTELLELAEVEGVEVEEGATNPAIREAIEAKRAG